MQSMNMCFRLALLPKRSHVSTSVSDGVLMRWMAFLPNIASHHESKSCVRPNIGLFEKCPMFGLLQFPWRRLVVAALSPLSEFFFEC
jgi:hypothetical protein